MIKIDQNYTEYFDANDPKYPGGKAIDAPNGDSFEGTKWDAPWFNTILGFFQAAIVKAHGSFKISGAPDNITKSDILDALIEIMKVTVNPSTDKRISDNTKNISTNTGNIANNIKAITSIAETLLHLVPEAPNNGRKYGRINKQWEEIMLPSGFGGDALEALKFFSKKTIMLTNAETADRRKKRYDIGLPYISYASEVYHFDTDYKNQGQGSTIELTPASPRIVGSNDFNGTIYFDPAVSDIPPYEPNGGSLLGTLSVKTNMPDTDSTVEFWIRIPQITNVCILRLKTDMQEEIILRTAGTDPYYSVPAPSEIEYSVPANNDIEYSVPATGDNRIYHVSPKGNESLAATGVSLVANMWLHIAVVASAQKFSVFIGNKQFDFNKHYKNLQNMKVTINEDRHEINLDELLIDRVDTLTLAAFTANTTNRKPYGALDHDKKWSVLMFDNPNRIVTNLFESEQFRMAVKTAIHSL